jgi:protein ImuA
MDLVPAVHALQQLHPSLWLGHQFGRAAAGMLASGFPALDAQLPGGGWPRQALTELLHPGLGEILLLAPCLAAVQRQARLVMLFDPPASLCASALQALAIDVAQLLVVQSQPAGTDPLWAFEQALKSGHVGAAIAWLPPRLKPERLRRLQLAAAAHDGPAFVLRHPAEAARPSPAPLRLALQAAGADRLELRILKRRGPATTAPLHLSLPPVLPHAVAGRTSRAAEATELPAAAFVNLA